MKTTWAVAMILVATLASPSAADVLHLSGGGTLEGEIVRQSETEITIKLGAGTVTLGRHMVTKIDKAPPPQQQYKERLAKLKPTAKAHVDLAGWCEDKYLSQQAQHHYREALRLDADNPSARMHLGYVKRGGQWLTRQDARQAREAEQAAKNGGTKIDHNFRYRARQYKTQLADLNRGPMNGWTYSEEFIEASKKVLAINDSAAVDPLCEVFGRQKDVAKRSLLVKALAGIGNDRAAEKLVDILAADPNQAVAMKAQNALATIDSPVAMQRLSTLMKTGNELARNRVAMALGQVGGAGAMDSTPALIRGLITREQRIIHHEPIESQRSWFATGTHYAYVSDLEPVVSEAAVAWNPVISYLVDGVVLDVKATVQPWNEYVWITVRHPSVLDSLRRITGQDFGWDVRAWYRWYWQSYVPSQAAAAAKSPLSP